ncbi:MAG: SRPBCC domain-containing protein [Candidatus Latescibacteria bacterium]|jgi:carbon monoxide dehydrogenase subunit G|nr:SRPBCC domain-containing protein [Candidatus Latescibacterota bacterium]
MTQLAGEQHFTQAPSAMWSHLIDAEFMARCMPQLERVEPDDSAFLVCRVRPGLAFLKGSIRAAFTAYDMRPPAALRMRIDSKGIGSSAVVETAIALTALDGGTRLAWTADIVELGGLLKPVSRGLIEAAARKIIGEGWAQFKEELG